MTKIFSDIIKEQKQNNPLGIYSVCSSHPFVIEAAIKQAIEDKSEILIEATSNQVDQFGGYTGMTPDNFAMYVYSVAAKLKFPIEKIILGGDHLGPNVWQSESAESAMQKAKEQIAAYVSAGFKKIHLDASMRCADDTENLTDEIIANRTVELCRVAVETAAKNNFDCLPYYVIGTEVPVPGGSQIKEETLHITKPGDVNRFISVTKNIFRKNNLENAWQRVIAVVVQPGVEFGDAEIHDYDRKKAAELSAFIKSQDMVYEAHSTDYQTGSSLKQMVEDHFAILKVGPWLTYSFREAVFALEAIQNEMFAGRKDIHLSKLKSVLEEVMISDPKYWKNHYKGSDTERAFARKYSYSDRARYYWNDERVNDELNLLLHNLRKENIPLTLLSQYLPAQYEAVRNGIIRLSPDEIIIHKIRTVLKKYSKACSIN